MPRSLAAALLTASILTGCAAGPTHPAAALPRELSLHPGEHAALSADTTLHYLGVESDSRCPPDVQCVWAGDALVNLRLDGPDGAQALVLHAAEPAPTTAGAWRLQLLRLDRGAAPAATLRIDAAVH